jgi:hypothetical protein
MGLLLPAALPLRRFGLQVCARVQAGEGSQQAGPLSRAGAAGLHAGQRVLTTMHTTRAPTRTSWTRRL